MKSQRLVLLGSFVTLTCRSYASKGYASDGLEFILVLAGVLMLLAGLLKGIDYISSHGRQLLRHCRELLHRIVQNRPFLGMVGR